MENPFRVEIEVDIDFELGSPPDDTVDPYTLVAQDVTRHSAQWNTQEGPTDGELLSSFTALYPPFTDATRRQVLMLLCYGTPTVTWNGQSLVLGNLWLTTDPHWAVPLVVSGLAEGVWFACEGELRTDFGKWKQGREEQIAL